MQNLCDYTLSELEAYLVESGFKAFNARQVFEWIYKKKVTDITKMSNLSKSLRAYLAQHHHIDGLKLFTKQVSKDQTTKFLFELEDGHLVEAVLMKHVYGMSLCVTTQVGCNIGCTFCASGLKKRIRNLTLSEMVNQVRMSETLANTKITHVVIMGTGEPFDNYDNVMRFIHVINSPYGFEIGARHITVSTSGLVPKIKAFAQAKTQVNLAISLHASNNKLRSALMPINSVYPIETLIDSVKTYIAKTNRRVTFEYLLLKGVNDTIQDADHLSDLLRGINSYVNLIPYNAVKEFDYQGSDVATQKAFHQRLLKRGITATLREEKGADIDAACGQLRANHAK